MIDFPLPDAYIDRIINEALAEDIGAGDVTTNSVLPASKRVSGQFIAKESGVICGIAMAAEVFYRLDATIRFSPRVSDGDFVAKCSIIAEVEGPARGILTGERVALNFLQRLSGISTRTNYFVSLISGASPLILDTRKTTPGLRPLEKYAVKTGGGFNHRMNLSEMILIKDNHIKAAGSIAAAVDMARKYVGHALKVEVEVESLEQVQEALDAGADIIMFDNMDVDTMKLAVEMTRGRALTEASGNITEQNIAIVAKTGIDYISVGALTHSVKAMDISLRLV